MIQDRYEINRGAEMNYHMHVRGSGADENPLTDILDRVEHKYHYRPEETGIYNPKSKAVVKLRNNGSIDMFSKEDVGIRVDQSTETVNLFANHVKTHTYDKTDWLTGSYTAYVKEHRSNKIAGNDILQVDGDIMITSKKGLQVFIGKDEKVTIGGNSNVEIRGNANVKVVGNLNAKVQEHATIEVDKNLNIRSYGNIDMHAYGYARIRSAKDTIYLRSQWDE